MSEETPRLLLNGQLRSVASLTSEELVDLQDTYGFAILPKDFFGSVRALVGVFDEDDAYPSRELGVEEWRSFLAGYTERFERLEFHPWVVTTIAGASLKLNGYERTVASLAIEDVRAVMAKAPKTGWESSRVDDLIGARAGLDDVQARRWLAAFAWGIREEGPVWAVKLSAPKVKPGA